MGRLGLSYDEVARVATQLLKEKNALPTVEAIRTALETTASTTTLVKHINTWKEERILMSTALSGGLMELAPEKISKYLGQLWTDLAATREQEMQQEREAKNQQILDLEMQLQLCNDELNQLKEVNQSLQNNCNNYLVQAHKDKLQIKAKDQELQSIYDKLYQTENLIPTLRDETEKRVKLISTQKDELIYTLQAEKEFLEEKYDKGLSFLQEVFTERYQKSEEAQRFLRNQLAHLEKQLEEKESKINEFTEKKTQLQEQVKHQLNKMHDEKFFITIFNSIEHNFSAQTKELSDKWEKILFKNLEFNEKRTLELESTVKQMIERLLMKNKKQDKRP